MIIRMKRIYTAAFASLLLTITASTATGETNLPKVEILGKEYYCYEVKKDDSIYGIAKANGWDLNELVRLNPNTVAKLKKGARLYYPTGKIVVVKDAEQPDLDDQPFAPITHVVKKGETVYSIARLYNIPLETIYSNHPSAKYGIKAGETIEIRQNSSNLGDGKTYLYYNVKHGDTLFALAQKYNTTVADILRANPGVSEGNLKIDSTIRIAVNSGMKRVRTELVDETEMASVDNYRVKKNDTWKEISQKTGVDEQTLRQANEDMPHPKKDEIIAVPKIKTTRVEREYVEQDPREATPEGREELYDSIHNIDSSQGLKMVKVALLMDDPSSKRDLEFSRGFLLAINQLKNSPYKISFKIIDGRTSTANVTEQIDDFEPDFLLSTADRNFPAFLADYGNENKVEIVNVFDVKNELYQDNPSIIQLLPPSNYFNDEVADFTFRNFKGRTLIMVGDADEGDAISESIRRSLDGATVLELTVNELKDFTFTDGDSYLLYSFPQKKDEVLQIVDAVIKGKEEAPLSDITLMGRPSWITMAESQKEKFADADVHIPSRFYFDSDSERAKKFNDAYASMFGHDPVRSYPMFAVTGYDVANYFIPGFASNGGDPNQGMPPAETLQTDIKLQRVSNWGGFLNPTCYMLHFIPGIGIDPIILK